MRKVISLLFLIPGLSFASGIYNPGSGGGGGGATLPFPAGATNYVQITTGSVVQNVGAFYTSSGTVNNFTAVDSTFTNITATQITFPNQGNTRVLFMNGSNMGTSSTFTWNGSTMSATRVGGSTVTASSSFYAPGLATCGDSTHALGYSSPTGNFSCQSLSGGSGSSISSGTIIQTVISSVTTSSATTVTSFVNTHLGRSFTATSASNFVRITVTGILGSSAGQEVDLAIARNGVNLCGSAGCAQNAAGASLLTTNWVGSTFVLYDTAPVTSAATYTVILKPVSGTGTFCNTNVTCSLILEEVNPNGGSSAQIVGGIAGNNAYYAATGQAISPDVNTIVTASSVSFNGSGGINVINQVTASTISVVLNGAIPTALTDNPLQVTANTNSFLQANIQNKSPGSTASSDYVATSDQGTNASHYIDLGINSSAFSSASQTVVPSTWGYLYTSDAGLAIGAGSNGSMASSAIVFFTSNPVTANARMAIYSTGTVQTFGNTIISSNTFMGGGTAFRTQTKTSNYTMTNADAVIFASSTITAISTITLPSASTACSQGSCNEIEVFKVDLATTPVIIIPQGSDTIAGLSRVMLHAYGAHQKLITDGVSTWYPRGPIAGPPQLIGNNQDIASAAALVASTTYHQPILLTQPCDTKSIGIHITVTGNTMSYGVYNNFGELVTSSGPFTTPAAGDRFIAVPKFNLQPGYYYLAMGVSSVTPTITRYASNQVGGILSKAAGMSSVTGQMISSIGNPPVFDATGVSNRAPAFTLQCYSGVPSQ